MPRCLLAASSLPRGVMDSGPKDQSLPHSVGLSFIVSLGNVAANVVLIDINQPVEDSVRTGI